MEIDSGKHLGDRHREFLRTKIPNAIAIRSLASETRFFWISSTISNLSLIRHPSKHS